jgi:hypothetical protein
MKRMSGRMKTIRLWTQMRTTNSVEFTMQIRTGSI